MRKAERQLFYFCIETLISVKYDLEIIDSHQLIQKVDKGKEDTLFLDIFPENILRRRLIQEYDDDIVFITEEEGGFNKSRLGKTPLVVFSDPTDRSSQFADFIRFLLKENESEDKNMSLKDLLNRTDIKLLWESRYGKPASITGSCCSLTVVKNSKLLFTISLNYITSEIFFSTTEICCYSHIDMIDINNLNHEIFDKSSNWKKISFNEHSHEKTLITFLGKDSYQKYFDDSKIFDRNTWDIIDQNPGGPHRILYLSELSDRIPDFIMANGEKIGEWLGWLLYVKASGQLEAFALTPKAVLARDEILLAPSEPYSILEKDENDELFINFEKLKCYPNPSRYREMIFITSKYNHHLLAEIEASRSRKLNI
jgi:hypothetical protein